MRIFLQDARDQVSELMRSVHMVWKRKSTFFYLFISILDIFGFKWRSTIYQGKANDSETPYIYLVTMSF